jgi:hypothetical protein
MRSKIIFIFLLLTSTLEVLSQEMEVVNGDLYFVIVDFVRWFDTPDSTLLRLENESYSGTDAISALFHELKDNGLLKKPFIRLLNSKGEVRTIFVSEEDFKEISRFDCWDLIEEGRKVEITVKVKRLDLRPSPLFIAVNPLSYKLVGGKTKHN